MGRNSFFLFMMKNQESLCMEKCMRIDEQLILSATFLHSLSMFSCSHKYVIERKLHSCMNARKRHSWNSFSRKQFSFLSPTFAVDSAVDSRASLKTFYPSFAHDTEKTPRNAKSNPINQHETSLLSQFCLLRYLFTLPTNIFWICWHKTVTTQTSLALKRKI